MGLETALAIGLIGSGFAASSAIRQTRKQTKRAERATAAVTQRPVETAPAVEEVKEEQKDIRKKRVNLFETAGGVAGEELQPEQITQRKTLLGN